MVLLAEPLRSLHELGEEDSQHPVGRSSPGGFGRALSRSGACESNAVVILASRRYRQRKALKVATLATNDNLIAGLQPQEAVNGNTRTSRSESPESWRRLKPGGMPHHWWRSCRSWKPGNRPWKSPHLQPAPRLPQAVLEDRLAEWRRLLRQSLTKGRVVIQRIVRGRIMFTPRDDAGYDFEAPTRFDKLFSGVDRRVA